MVSLKRVARRFIRARYKAGRFYRIPFGKNRGRWIEYDESINLDMMFGLHEPNSFEVFRQVIRAGMTVVDIGANVGYFSVHFDKLVGSEGKVYAFEPVPATFCALERMISRNNCERTTLIQKAAANINGEVEFFVGHTHYMASLNPKWAGPKSRAIRAVGIRLDDFVSNAGIAPNFIKMDIEGGGTVALSGMKETIKSCRPFLLLESHTPSEDSAIGVTLSENHYNVFRVGQNDAVLYLDRDYRDKNGVWGTVLGVPEHSLEGLDSFNAAKFQRSRLGQRVTVSRGSA